MQSSNSGMSLRFIHPYAAKPLTSYTDFLVYEVDLDGKVVNVKSLARSSSDLKRLKDTEDIDSAKSERASPTPPDKLTTIVSTESGDVINDETTKLPDEVIPEPHPDDDADSWQDRFDSKLTEYLSDSVILQLKELYLEGPEPPFVSDAGWEGRKAKHDAEAMEIDESSSQGRGRGGKSKRGGGRGRGRGGKGIVDNRKVVTDVCSLELETILIHKFYITRAAYQLKDRPNKSTFCYKSAL